MVSTRGRRYLVPDLSPLDREALSRMRPRFAFVAESPHLNEIQPEEKSERRPLCGMAGRQWWSLLSELLEGEANPDVSLERLISLCLKHRIAVLNAVQFPLDPKISKKYPGADPIENLGFCKASGPYHYKKLKNSPEVRKSLQSLRDRLNHPSLSASKVICLGNDAEWFVQRALLSPEEQARLGDRIPHPSAWWRRGGLFGRIAREKLEGILGKL